VESPRIALRFRDAILGVDTIAEHRAVIAQEGAVWWGWWKKTFEPPYADVFDQLGTSNGNAVLIDRATRRCYLAGFLKIVRSGQATIDETRIPAYYRHAFDQVAAWFLLNEISEMEYQDDLGLRLGEATFLLINTDERTPAVVAPSSNSIVAKDRNVVLHLSDLHFGADYAFLSPGARPSIGEQRQTLTTCLIEDLKRIGVAENVGAILITGDFTTEGDWSDLTQKQILDELSSLLKALNLSKEHIVAVPGNHDIVRYPAGTSIDLTHLTVDQQTTYKHERDFRIFHEQLTGRHWNEPLNRILSYRLKTVDLQVCVLNSCTIVATQWTEYGYVGPGGIDVLRNLGNSDVSRPTFRLMALHHHLVPVNRVDVPNEKGVSLTLDAVELLDAADRYGVHLAVHGHQHLPRIVQYRSFPLLGSPSRTGMFIICVGSAGAIEKRRPGAERNSYSALRFESDGVQMWMRELRTDAKPGAPIFDDRLSIKPLESA
jgi:3',5'-cyclic AMP phosphodiesterase CpdA